MSYQMTCFHPGDFDYEQPKVPGLSLFRYFKSYYGLKDCQRKFAHILSQNEFQSNRLEVIDQKVLKIESL